MGKSNFKNLYIDRNIIKGLISEYCRGNYKNYRIEGPILKKENTGQNRYFIKTDEMDFEVDFYFRKDKKTSLVPLGGFEEKQHATKLCQYIKNQCDYDDVITVSFSTIVQKDKVDLLAEYLQNITNIDMVRNEMVNNGAGTLYQFISDDGDKITLTYYNTTDRLLYQGKIMKLYIEVKQFLSAFIDTKKIKEEYAKKLNINNDNIEKEFKSLLPSAYGNIDIVIQDFLYDAIVFSKLEIPVKEYSSYAFPALKALEGYIKHIFGDNNIQIANKYGFTKRYKGKTIPYFNRVDSSIYKLNKNAVEIHCTKTCTALEDCYSYYNSQRHSIAHVDYPLVTTRRLPKKEDALEIIYGVIDLIERTYINMN